MKNYSTTQMSNYATFAGVAVVLLSKIGVDTDTETLMTIAGGVVALYGLIKNFVNRHKKGDVTMLGRYKQEE